MALYYFAVPKLVFCLISGKLFVLFISTSMILFNVGLVEDSSRGFALNYKKKLRLMKIKNV